MFVASSGIKSLQNEDTGIDISVPKVIEMEAPLGGTSIEYEIAIYTTLQNFKANFHKEEEIVHFSVQKAYREIEDFYDKVRKKWRNEKFPVVPQRQSTLKHSSEEKLAHLDAFMKHISKNKDVCHSTLFQQFIGVNRIKKMKSATPNLKSPSTEEEDSPDSANKDLNNDVQEEPIENSNDTAVIEDIFPKMKVRKSSKSDPLNEYASEDAKITKLPSEDLDLFEEVKQIKEVQNKEQVQLFEPESRMPHQALFDTEDDADLFRVNSPTPPKPKEKPKVPKDLKVEKKPEPKPIKKNDDDVDELFQQDIFSERTKFGKVSLFQEQDFGNNISKDDEALFYIPEGEGKKSKINPFLSPSSDSTEENDIEETLEEITGCILPSTSRTPHVEDKGNSSGASSSIEGEDASGPTASQDVESDVLNATAPQKQEESTQPPKPLPKPKPQASEIPKKPPVAAKKPSLAPKPTLPPKPKPAAKPNALKSPEEPSQPVAEKAKDGVSDFMDIMQYIEQEQKMASSETSLFE